MKNTQEEMKQTLAITSNQISPELGRAIAELPVFETIYKWVDKEKVTRLGHFRNLYMTSEEIRQISKNLSGISCKNKKPICIDGAQPHTFQSQIPYYKEFEKNADSEEQSEDDIWMYPGVPCSFYLAKPFLLQNNSAQNILLAGGKRNSQASVMMSLKNSYKRSGHVMEVWSSKTSPLLKKYKNSIFEHVDIRTDLHDICREIARIKQNIIEGNEEQKLIFVLGYEMLCSDMELFGGFGIKKKAKRSETRGKTLDEVMKEIMECKDPAERRRLRDEYNRQAQNMSVADTEEETEIYDAREDMKWILKRAPKFGTHFVVSFEQAADFHFLRMDPKAFHHKIVFAMSKDDSLVILGNAKASQLEDNMAVYSDDMQYIHYRPHIYKEIPYSGWQISENGEVIQGR